MKPASVGEICSAVFCRRVGQNTRTQTPKSLPAVSDCRVSEQSGGGRECARAIEHDQRACGQSKKTKAKPACLLTVATENQRNINYKHTFKKKRSVSLLLLNDNRDKIQKLTTACIKRFSVRDCILVFTSKPVCPNLFIALHLLKR